MVKKASKSPPNPVSWPVITPRTSKYIDQYRIEEIIEDQIIVIHNLFTQDNSQRYLRFFTESIKPLLASPSAPRRGEATRTNERFAIKNPSFAKTLLYDSDLSDITTGSILDNDHGKAFVGLNSNIRIYRYSAGTFFGPHYDESVKNDQGSWSAWTLLIYFIDNDLKGGETSFILSDGQKIAPKLENGMALLHR